EIVRSDRHTTRNVVRYRFTRSDTEYRRKNPVTIAASRIAVPVAESQLKMNTAPSGVALPTTGGTRDTSLSKPGIGKLGAERWFRNVFTCGVPHANTITTSTTHGVIAVRSDGAARAGTSISVCGSATPGAAPPARDVARPRVAMRNHARQLIQHADAMMSTNHGPWELDTRDCGTANVTPATNSGAHSSRTPRSPEYAAINQNGTISEKTGNCRPIIALRWPTQRLVTHRRAMIGVPSAPKATGAVFAMSESADASSGGNPSPMSIAPVTATGVPNPAAPSKNAPKQNAISSSGSRRSVVMPMIARCSVTNTPRSSVSLYRKMTLSTIQPIGRNPYAAPSRAARPAMDPGMPMIPTAIASAAANPASA